MQSANFQAACPAMTELEMIMLDWFGRMIGLPDEFLPFTEGTKGGGVIQVRKYLELKFQIKLIL